MLKHTDGNIMQFVDDFFSMGIDGYQSIEPYAGMDIGFIKQKYGDKVLLMGNIDCARTLPFGSKEEVVKETIECMKQAFSWRWSYRFDQHYWLSHIRG